ncbi:hypothetical protein IAR50_004502 [Cryptococcus sp. DSM 104548]
MPVFPSIISPPRHAHSSREFTTGNSHTVMHHRLYAPSNCSQDDQEGNEQAGPEQSIKAPTPRRRESESNSEGEESETNSERAATRFWRLFDGLMDVPNFNAPSSTSIETDPDMDMPAYIAHLESHHFHDPSPAFLDHCCRLASSEWYRSRYRPIAEPVRGPTALERMADDASAPDYMDQNRIPTRPAPRQDTTPVRSQSPVHSRATPVHSSADYHRPAPPSPLSPTISRRAPAPSIKHRISSFFGRDQPAPRRPLSFGGTTRGVGNTRSTPAMDEMGRRGSSDNAAALGQRAAVQAPGSMIPAGLHDMAPSRRYASRQAPTIAFPIAADRPSSLLSTTPSWLRSDSSSDASTHPMSAPPSTSSTDSPPPPPYAAPANEFQRDMAPALLRPHTLHPARSSQELRSGRYSPYGGSSSSSGGGSTSRDRRGYARLASTQSSRVRLTEDSGRPSASLLGPATPSRTHHSRISRDLRLPSPAHPTALPSWGSFDVVGDRNEVQSFGNMGFVNHSMNEPEPTVNENMARRLSVMSMEVDPAEPGSDRLLALAFSPSPSITTASESSSSDYRTVSTASLSNPRRSVPEPKIQPNTLYSVHIARFVEAVQYRNAMHVNNPSCFPRFTINGTIIDTWADAIQVDWDAQSLYPVAEYWACKFKQGRKEERRGRMCFVKLREGLLHAYAFARDGQGLGGRVERKLRDLWEDLANDWELTN